MNQHIIIKTSEIEICVKYKPYIYLQNPQFRSISGTKCQSNLQILQNGANKRYIFSHQVATIIMPHQNRAQHLCLNIPHVSLYPTFPYVLHCFAIQSTDS